MAGTDARRTTIELLTGVLGERQMLSECLGAPGFLRLAPEDRARAQRLATQVLRGLERTDKILGRYLKKAPGLWVRNALRLGTVELCSGGAAHGVVSDLVEIVGRHRRHGHLKDLVNAVLRKVAAEGPELWPRLRVPRMPGWLRDPLVAAWGREAVTAIEAAQFAGAPLDLTSRGELTSRGDVAPEGELLPTGSVRLSDPGQVSALLGYETGDWWVQDAAAALPARLLAAGAGDRVLDMCAAPGGKTLQLAAAGAEVTALDISKTRMARVEKNLARTGLEAELVVCDALNHEGLYDAILLDAPCSATGTMRRHPDLPFAKDGSEFGDLIDLQSRMIDHAWGLLAPGRRMVFCTCSLLPDEGEVQVEEALARHPDMRADRMDLPGVATDWRTEEGGLRLRPDYWADLGGMDGFYMARLVKETPPS